MLVQIQYGLKQTYFMCNSKMLRKMLGTGTFYAVLALSVCFNQPLGLGKRPRRSSIPPTGGP